MRALLVPFSISASGGVAATSDIDTIVKQQILDVLVTGVNERIMRPKHGAGINTLLFDVADDNSLADVSTVATQRCSEQISLCIVRKINIVAQEALAESGIISTGLVCTALYQIPPDQDVRTAVFTLPIGLITEETA